MTGKSFTISAPSGAGEAGTPGQRWAVGWWMIAGASLIAIAGIVLIMLVWNWPFTQKAVTKALQDRFARPVQIRHFRLTYFPPG